jgi:hypothetical protein
MKFRLPWRRSPRFRPTPPRQRLLIVAAAVGITLLIGTAMLARHVEFLRAKLARRDASEPPRCAPGQTEGCVGGTMGVIVVPAASAPPGR